MKHVSLDEISTVYDCARLAEFEVHHVDNVEFHRFCLLLNGFERSLGESSKDNFWRPFLRALKRYRFDISSTPLPFDFPTAHSPSLVERLRAELEHSDLIYPQFATPARELVNRVQALHDYHSNPILAACAGIGESDAANVAVLIKETRHISAVEKVLNDEIGIGAVEVISPSQLKGHRCFSELMVFGAVRWYGDYVFQSPRANRIHIVKYRWVNDSFTASQVFIGSKGNSCVDWIGGRKTPSVGSKQSDILPDNSFDAEDLLPSIDWDDVLRMVSARTTDDSDHEEEDEEYVSARLFPT